MLLLLPAKLLAPVEELLIDEDPDADGVLVPAEEESFDFLDGELLM